MSCYRRIKAFRLPITYRYLKMMKQKLYDSGIQTTGREHIMDADTFDTVELYINTFYREMSYDYVRTHKSENPQKYLDIGFSDTTQRYLDLVISKIDDEDETSFYRARNLYPCERDMLAKTGYFADFDIGDVRLVEFAWYTCSEPKDCYDPSADPFNKPIEEI